MSTLIDVISPEYRAQLQEMRDPAHKPLWGNGGQRHLAAVLEVVDRYGVKSLIDYGCGLGMLMAEIAKVRTPAQLTLVGYDPGITEFSALPEQTDMVVSTDVLEHVEPDKLDGVLTHIRMLTGKVAYLHIHTGPARAILPDGRNAHLIQRPAKWWQDRLRSYYSSVEPVVATSGARAGTQIFGDYRPTFVCV